LQIDNHNAKVSILNKKNTVWVIVVAAVFRYYVGIGIVFSTFIPITANKYSFNYLIF